VRSHRVVGAQGISAARSHSFRSAIDGPRGDHVTAPAAPASSTTAPAAGIRASGALTEWTQFCAHGDGEGAGRGRVPADEIVSTGVGSEHPLVKPDNTPAKKAKNRRYEMRLRL
jgi:hypothetical protein